MARDENMKIRQVRLNFDFELVKLPEKGTHLKRDRNAISG